MSSETFPSTLKISVVVCTHNPRRDYLNKVLRGLQNQTLPAEHWEVFLIDNASREPLSSSTDLSWHPNASCLREEKLGLTPARLRGIAESSGQLLVFVDDDNVLDPDYLEQAGMLASAWPQMGAFSGQVRAEFEIDPPEWTKQHWHRLAIREFDSDRWSNIPCLEATTPNGAGLCVRRPVADQYLKYHNNGQRKFMLDRTGNSLMSAGDLDLATTACDLGLGNALFSSLRLTHLIPKERLSEDYLLRLFEDQTFSFVVMQSFRTNGFSRQRRAWWSVVEDRLRGLKMGARERRIRDAVRTGEQKALHFLFGQSPSS